MRLVYEYTNTPQDLLAQHELVNPDAYRIARQMHHRFLALPIWAMLIGVYAAAMANNVALVGLIVVVVGIPLCAAIPFAARYRSALQESLGSRPPADIRLDVTDDGLRQTVAEIQSLFPWTAIRRFEVVHDTLFIAFAANLWAIIPRRSLSPSSDSLDDLIRVLQEKTVGQPEDA